MVINTLCVRITFNNILKVCFSNKKYPIAIQASPTQFVKVYFSSKNRVLTDFFKDCWYTKSITYHFLF